MPLRPRQLARASVPTSGSVTLYTAPAASVATYVTVKQVLLANVSTTLDATVNINLGGVTAFRGVVAAGSTTIFDLSQLLDPGQTIVASLSNPTGSEVVAAHVAGVVAEV